MKTYSKEKEILFLGIAKTKNGVIFNPNEDIWNISDANLKILFKFKQILLSETALYELKKVFKWYLENHSPSHSYNMYKYLKKLSNFLFKLNGSPIKKITDIDLINFRAYLGKTQEWQLGSFSGFLKKWYEMGYSCVSKSAYGYLNETKIKGNPKGVAVSTMDPHEGPYSDLELEAIQVAINNAYAEGKLSNQNYLLVWLFMVYGSRPIQFAQLKVKDIISIVNKSNINEMIINIPRAKNRKKVRTEFKRRIVPPSLTKILHKQCEHAKKTFKLLLKNPEEAPLFYNIKDEAISSELAFHLKSNDITNIIKKIFNDLNLISERTGEKLHVVPKRFRYTLGTRAAAEGHGELIIAEILDHTDIQNAGVYVEASPEIIERLDKSLAIHMAPLAQAFTGVLLEDKTKAIRANDSDADIIDPKIDSTCTPTGKCGSYSFCGLMSPLACYTCSSFQAWTDGPHESVLLYLIEERKRLLKATDYRIASINDKTILAVAQVVLACRQFNNQANDIEVLK